MKPSFDEMQATSDTVREHYLTGMARIYIAKGLETTVRGFTGFYPYYDARLRVGVTHGHAPPPAPVGTGHRGQ